MHYKDAAGLWQDCDESYSEVDGLDGFTAKFTKCFYHVRLKDGGVRRIYPDRNDLSYWIQIDKPNGITMGAPVKSGNTWTWDFDHAQIKVQMQSAQVKFSFILKDSSAPTSITIPFSVQGITRTGNILYHNGIPCGKLAKPVAVDTNRVRRDCTATFGTGQVTVNVDTTGLAYPIDIDPTVNLIVGADTDDCIRRLISDVFLTGGTNYVAAGRWNNTDKEWGSGMRFLATGVPQGANITAATLTLRAERTFTRDGSHICNTRISADDVDDAATFSTSADYDTRWAARTTARVDWDGIPGQTVGEDYTSVDFSPVIQEVVIRASFTENSDIVVFWDDHENRSTGEGSGTLMGYSTGLDHETSTTHCPKLDITYTAGSKFVPQVID